MALSILGVQVQFGIELAETGINVSDISVDYMPEVDDPTLNFQNQRTGVTRSTLAKREFSITYEEIIGSATGLTGATFLTDSVSLIANDKTQFGAPAGLILLDHATVKQSRGGKRTVDMKLSSYPLFTTV